MENRAILSIDLGSAHTKIALRSGWNARSQLMHDLPLAPRDLTYCVPSVVARVKGAGREHWLIGNEAAGRRPGPDVAVHTNWKAGLFSKTGGGESAECGRTRALTHDECVDLGTRFLHGVRKSLKDVLGDANRTEVAVRVSVPHLNDGIDPNSLIPGLLEEGGWKSSTRRPTVFEPESNSIGILTRGLNHTWSPRGLPFKPVPGRTVFLPEMLDAAVMAAFREGGKGHRYAYYGVLTIDIGAFTTDFGYVRFDSSVWTEEPNKPELTSESVPLGIRDLDREVVESVSQAARSAIEARTVSEWDGHKAELYAGSPQQIVSASGHPVPVGHGEEGREIGRIIKAFADRVWGARQRFLKGISHRVDAEIVSGGGVMIHKVRKPLIDRIKTERSSRIHDLTDPEEPSRVLPLLRQGELDRRRRENLELVRGGSAVGGCSVFLE